MLLYFGYKSTKACNRCSLRRRAGVSSITFCSKLHIGFALLKDTHHCKVSRNSSNGFRNDSSTLITQKEQPVPLRCSSFTSFGAPSPAHSSVQEDARYTSVGGTKPSASSSSTASRKAITVHFVSAVPRPHTLPSQYLRKKERESTLLCRNDILMTHQKDRLFGGFSLPII